MQASLDPGTGKYVISFNGVVYSPCSSPTDCPGNAQCWENTTIPWIDAASMCGCDPTYGLVGINCDQIGPWGVFTVFICIVIALLALYPIVCNTRNLYKVALLVFPHSAITKVIMAGCIVSGCTLFAFDVSIVVDAATANNANIRANVGVANSIFFVIYLAVFSLVMVNTSIIWLSAADASLAFFSSKMFEFKARTFQFAVFTLSAVFVIASIVLMAKSSYTATAEPAAVVIILVIMLYLRGWWRLSRLAVVLRETAARLRTGTSSADATSTTQQSVLQAIDHVCHSALLMACSLICSLAFDLAFLLVNGFEGGDTPAASLGEFTLQMGLLFSVIAFILLTRYLNSLTTSTLARHPSSASKGVSAPASGALVVVGAEVNN
jgi:hypothetical protein